MWRRLPSDPEWAYSRVAKLPNRWAKRLLHRWNEHYAQDYRQANVELLEATQPALHLRISLDTSDSSICDHASAQAARCAGRAEIFHSIDTLRAAMERVCHLQGIEPPNAKVKDRSALARMTCHLWWRHKLRKHHGRSVEAAAIGFGFVSRKGDLYVSKEGLQARLQQNARNVATLEATMARNELGQEFTLKQLAERSTANKKVRRSELMTRIAGFERKAVADGHSGLFITITCPSRFHRFRTLNKGKTVIGNPNYDPAENPGTAQRQLAKLWTHIRSELDRRGAGVYGFRIAEPQHDGTPHWHLLLFCKEEHSSLVESIIKKHALKDSPDEPGALEHRCDFKKIDWSKGSAAGYIAKYVAKNIDGAFVGNDLEGKPATETAVRVEAWAALWGIRQFQQIGGPPVGVWRELRRIKKLPLNAPDCLREAHAAANKQTHVQGREEASVAWDRYCEAQGGVFCGRKAPIKMMMATPEKLGRYGDEPTPRPIGVETTVLEHYPVPWNPGTWAHRRTVWAVESSRHKWEIVRATQKPSAGEFSAERAQPEPPWTSVNNCTQRDNFYSEAINKPSTNFTSSAVEEGGMQRSREEWPED